MSKSFSQLSKEEKADLISFVQVAANGPVIRTLMYNKYKIIINQDTISTARRNFTMETLEAIGLDPCHSACDRLLVYFRNRPDITFISVTHTIDSGFVTMKKDKRRETDVLSQINSSNTGGIDTQDIMNWRNTLKVDDGKKILVALAWMHDEDKRSLKMFPEIL